MLLDRFLFLLNNNLALLKFFLNLIERKNKNNNLVKTSFISLFSVARSMGISKEKMLAY